MPRNICETWRMPDWWRLCDSHNDDNVIILSWWSGVLTMYYNHPMGFQSGDSCQSLSKAYLPLIGLHTEERGDPLLSDGWIGSVDETQPVRLHVFLCEGCLSSNLYTQCSVAAALSCTCLIVKIGGCMQPMMILTCWRVLLQAWVSFQAIEERWWQCKAFSMYLLNLHRLFAFLSTILSSSALLCV